MEIVPKDIEWLESVVPSFNGKDVECDDERGPIYETHVHRNGNGTLVTVKPSWWAHYEHTGWIKVGNGFAIQFLNPEVELIDEKAVRLTSGCNYCVIFFGYENIEPQEPGISGRN